MSLEILLNIHAYPSFVLSRYFLKLSIYLVLKLTLVISLYGILVSASHFPSASNSLIVSLFFPAFKIIPIWYISSFSFSIISFCRICKSTCIYDRFQRTPSATTFSYCVSYFSSLKSNCRIYNTAVSYLQKPSALFYHSRPLISSPKVIIVVPSIVTRSPSPPLFHRIPYSPPLYPAFYPARYRRAYPFSSFLLYATDRLQQEYHLAE